MKQFWVTCRLIDIWQNRRSRNTNKAVWTRRLIPLNIPNWLGCKFKETNYYPSPFYIGHGSVRAYTYRIGKTPDSNYNRIITRSSNNPGKYSKLIANITKWVEVTKELIEIMKYKEEEERDNQGR